MSKLSVAIMGAAGLAGQQFLTALTGHPMFQVTRVVGSQRSSGKKMSDAVKDEKGASRWFASRELPREFADLVVEDAASFDPSGVDLVFSAVESDAAKELEPRLAKTTPVVSTASAYRYEADVPIFLPCVNFEHAPLLNTQRKSRGWKGFITPIPNCTTTGMAITLKPLADAFGIKSVLMTSMQACSGAGRSPGVIALDIIDNIIPYIPKEEEKVQLETKKILGALQGDKIIAHDVAVSATCTRVPVMEGHTESVFVSLEKKASLDEVKAALRAFGKDFSYQLPSLPRDLISIHEDPYRPQPRIDRDAEDGMSTVVGRLREDPALPNGIKYMLVSHNTKMGAAKGAILVAEYLCKAGYV